MQLRFRPFGDADYGRYIEIRNRNFPEDKDSEAEVRHYDDSWDHERYYRRRLVAETAEGLVVGYGQISHMQHQFHPDKYWLDLQTHPDWQRRGVGAALFERLTGELAGRGAVQARAEAKESMGHSVAFLERRGFVEAQKSWESRLDLATFDFGRFAGAEERVARQGIMISTLAAERGRDSEALRKAYELDTVCSRDEPALDPITPISFETWRSNEIETPTALPDAYFLAMEGDRYVGMSSMYFGEEEPEVLWQGFTAVRPERRGKGVAMALKLRTVRYGRERGMREIRTWNNTRNRPMLRINEAMGFEKQPVWIEYMKALPTGAGEAERPSPALTPADAGA